MGHLDMKGQGLERSPCLRRGLAGHVGDLDRGRTLAHHDGDRRALLELLAWPRILTDNVPLACRVVELSVDLDPEPGIRKNLRGLVLGLPPHVGYRDQTRTQRRDQHDLSALADLGGGRRRSTKYGSLWHG